MLREVKRISNQKPVTSNQKNLSRAPLLALTSSLLLILSFPPFDIEILAWLTLVPLLFAIEGKRPIEAFLIAYLSGVIFFLGTIWWLIHVTLPGMIIVVLYEALFFGLFGLLSTINYKLSTINSILFLPSTWVALEWLRSIGPFGFGWNLLGYSQYLTLPIIQIADITGVWGVSFLILFVNVCIYKVIKALGRGARLPEKRIYIPVAAMTLLSFIVLHYGHLRLNNIFTGQRLRAAVVQGNIPQKEKWDLQFKESILDKYEALTKEAALEKPDIIIWPETAVPGFLDEAELKGRVSALAGAVGTPLLIGAPREEGGLYYNSAFLFSKDGRISSHYDKLHLVPFGEYVPFRAIFAFAEKFAPRPIGDFTKGKRPTVFTFDLRRSSEEGGVIKKVHKKVNFSVLICFEDIFPDLVRGFMKEGAGLLVNITNDAWFLKTAAPYQHAQASVFRAVEARTNVIRAANTGLSCFIDQKGRITAKAESGGRDTFIEGFKIQEVVLSRAKTFYVKFGDIFAYIAIALTLIVPWMRKRRP